MDKPAEQQKILKAALPHVVFDGWSMAALHHGARDAGLSEGNVARAFPNGVVDALEAYARLGDEAMEVAYTSPPAKIRERIEMLVALRLQAYHPHEDAARRALAIYALPAYAPLGLANLARTVDAMWHLAGDTSADMNWYSKRALLAGVYSSTLLVWLNDNSENHAKARAFLKRRIEDVMRIEKWKGKLSFWVKREG